jgi:copper chaperone CopZ/uncharacterized membrane protein YphA (DoxX/SURF4 family)
MKHTYQIDGMHCGSCIAKVKNELLKLGDVAEADVQLKTPQATITMLKHISTPTLQQAVAKAGNFSLKEIESDTLSEDVVTDKKNWLAIYKPLLLIFAFITGIAFITAIQHGQFHWMNWMLNFMGGFFITFSFFKLLNLKGFSDSYSMYDIVARRWYAWGFVYAFIELALGIAFISGFAPLITNAVTFVVMSISIVGVLQSVLNKRKIRCACLGDVFNLPMSTVTVIEDALMIGMSAVMLVMLS